MVTPTAQPPLPGSTNRPARVMYTCPSTPGFYQFHGETRYVSNGHYVRNNTDANRNAGGGGGYALWANATCVPCTICPAGTYEIGGCQGGWESDIYDGVYTPVPIEKTMTDRTCAPCYCYGASATWHAACHEFCASQGFATNSTVPEYQQTPCT